MLWFSTASFHAPQVTSLKLDALLALRYTARAWNFWGAKSRTSLPQKVQPFPPSVFSAGGGYGSDGGGGGGGGGGETAVSDGYTAKLVPALPHSLTTTPAICSSAHLQTARHRSTEDKVR